MEERRKNDPAVQQIIDRIIGQHFSNDPCRQKTIGEMEDEICAQVVKNVKYSLDF